MKTFTSLFAAFAFTAISAGAVVAGSPDNPGGLGETVGAVQDAAQAATGHQNGFGQAVKENNALGNPSLGQQLQAAKGFLGAAPNPANDNGHGND